MKNLSLALNIVLLVAVGVLYFLHFSGGKSSSDGVDGSVVPSDLKIAYVNSDTLSKYYDYLEVNRVQFQSKTQKMETEYRNRVAGLQNEIAAYQRNVNNMTLSQVRATEEDLGKKQQNLQLLQQSLQQQVVDEQNKINEELYGKVTSFLKKYGEENGLQIVLKYDAGSDVLFGGKALDITKNVVEGLNAAYKAEKSGAVKADSTAAK